MNAPALPRALDAGDDLAERAAREFHTAGARLAATEPGAERAGDFAAQARAALTLGAIGTRRRGAEVRAFDAHQHVTALGALAAVLTGDAHANVIARAVERARAAPLPARATWLAEVAHRARAEVRGPIVREALAASLLAAIPADALIELVPMVPAAEQLPLIERVCELVAAGDDPLMAEIVLSSIVTAALPVAPARALAIAIAMPPSEFRASALDRIATRGRDPERALAVAEISRAATPEANAKLLAMTVRHFDLATVERLLAAARASGIAPAEALHGRLAALGRADDALALARALPPGLARTRALVSVAFASEGDARRSRLLEARACLDDAERAAGAPPDAALHAAIERGLAPHPTSARDRLTRALDDLDAQSTRTPGERAAALDAAIELLASLLGDSALNPHAALFAAVDRIARVASGAQLATVERAWTSLLWDARHAFGNVLEAIARMADALARMGGPAAVEAVAQAVVDAGAWLGVENATPTP